MKTIDDAEAIRILADQSKAYLLTPFFQRALPLKEAAAQLGQPLETIYRPLQRLVRVGLLEVVHTENRPGRPVKYYRTTAQHFFVPAASTFLEYVVLKNEHLWRARLERGLLHTWFDSEIEPDSGLHVYYDPVHSFRIIFGRDPGTDRVAKERAYVGWHRWSLSEHSALALRRGESYTTLQRVTARYRTRVGTPM